MPNDKQLMNGAVPPAKPTPSATWSESLQQQTREAINDLDINPDGRLHFKHRTLGYAFATLDGIIGATLTLCTKSTNQTLKFEGVETLLLAGWALD